MTTHFGSLLGRVVGREKGVAERKGHVQWPDNVLACLETEFCLLPKDMVLLRCVGRRRSLGGLPAIFVRVYDPVTAFEQGIIIKDYRDLDKHTKLVLFEGYILKDGTVHLRKGEGVFLQRTSSGFIAVR